MRHFVPWLAAALLAAQPSPGRRSYDVDKVPAHIARPVAVADAAIAALQQRLAQRLLQELERGGPVSAVRVCRDDAPAISAAVSTEKGIQVGRTSHLLRNSRNAPRAWARQHVEAALANPAAEIGAVAVDLGDRVGVLRPILTGAVCTRCHGDPKSFPPELARVLRESYPRDRAVGFAEGDLRGFFWAEAPKQRP